MQDVDKYRDQYLDHLGKYAQVCTTWRDVILSSKAIKDKCKDQTIYNLGINERRLVQNGFLSIVGRIHLGAELTYVKGVGMQRSSNMDHMKFVRACIKNNVTAINKFTIEVDEHTNIEALTEILAMSPSASTFTLDFHAQYRPSTLSVQKQAELFWKVLHIVFYCNAEDKTVNISDFNLQKTKPVDWSFIRKPMYQHCQTVPKPGTVKLLYFSKCRFGQSTPDLKRLSVPIERIGFQLDSEACDHGFLTNTMTKCLQVRIGVYTFARDIYDLLNNRLLKSFSKFERLEIHFEEFNDTYDLESYCLVLSKIRHSNLHLVLVNPFRIGDVFKVDDFFEEEDEDEEEDYFCYDCHDGVSVLWKKDDVKYFLNLVQHSSAKTLTYPLAEKSKNVTFNCDANFDSTFMKFLDTQPIFIGRDDQRFTTLQLAKESFDNGCKCYCTEHCRCDGQSCMEDSF